MAHDLQPGGYVAEDIMLSHQNRQAKVHNTILQFIQAKLSYHLNKQKKGTSGRQAGAVTNGINRGKGALAKGRSRVFVYAASKFGSASPLSSPGSPSFCLTKSIPYSSSE
jgi:hypothetical protein